jgi:hypothetical protein
MMFGAGCLVYKTATEIKHVVNDCEKLSYRGKERGWSDSAFPWDILHVCKSNTGIT